MRHYSKIIMLFIGVLYATATLYAQAITQITNTSNQTIVLPNKVERVISLTPNITELIFSAGAGAKIVGTVAHSDYPEQAKKIQNIGSYENINLEILLTLKPDLVFAWENGTSVSVIRKIKSLGLTVFMVDASNLHKIPDTIETLGKVLGTPVIANKNAAHFRHTLTQLKPQPTQHPHKVFIHIWDKPLITLNQNTIFSEIISFCGGHNIFANHPLIAPKVTIESVLKQQPEFIFMSGNSNLDFWKSWQNLPAVPDQHIYTINPDYTNRATMRTLLAVEKICKILNTQ